jgi:hypothetical protein
MVTVNAIHIPHIFDNLFQLPTVNLQTAARPAE